MRQRRRAKLGLMFLMACLAPALHAAEVGDPASPSPDPESLRMEADNFAFLADERVFVGWGNVTLTRGDSVLMADRFVVWPDDEQKQGYVEGHVRLFQDGSVSRADRAFFNWAEEKGIVFDFRARVSEPGGAIDWFVSAQEIHRSSATHFEAHDATFTTSSFCVPDHYFKADYVQVDLGDRIVAHNVLYYAKGVPVLFLPYVYRDLDQRRSWLRAQIGSASRLGGFVSTQVGQSLGEHVDLGANFHYMTDRGFATGLELGYRWPGIEGQLDSLWLPSDRGRDRNGLELGNTNRWRYKFAHHQTAPQGWEVVAELQKYSDAGVRSEFFEDESKVGKEIENRLYVKYARDNYDATALLKVRDDSFLDASEYLPRLGLDLYGQPVLDTFLLTVNTEAAYADRKFSDLHTRPTDNPYVLPLPRLLWWLDHQQDIDDRRLAENAPLPYPDPLTEREALSDGRRTLRLHSDVELAAPVGCAGTVVEPFLVGRGSWYSSRLEDAGAAWRGQGGVGLRWSAQVSKVYNTTSKAWDIDGLRHVIVPELRVQSLSEPTVDKLQLYEIDAVDDLQREDRVALALTNRVEVKGLDQSRRDVLFLELELERAQRADGSRDSALANLRFSPFEDLYFFVDADVTLDTEDPFYESGLEAASAGLSFEWSPQWTFFIGNRFLRGDSSRTTLEVAGELSDRYSGRLYVEYDWSIEHNTTYGFAVLREVDDLAFELGFEHKQRTSENRVFFNFHLRTDRPSPVGEPFVRTAAEGQDLILK